MIFENSNKMKFERSHDMCDLKKEIIIYLFDQISKRKRDQWWNFKGEFKYEGEVYNLECDVMCDGILFTYKNLHIEHKQRVIDIDEMIQRGLIQ
jgi:hypothetical protein